VALTAKAELQAEEYGWRQSQRTHLPMAPI
jgi:hypothetical protein